MLHSLHWVIFCVCQLNLRAKVQETAASKKALAEAERAENEKHAKWLEAEKAGKSADEYAAKKLDKVEEVLHGRMEALSLKAQVKGFQASHVCLKGERPSILF